MTKKSPTRALALQAILADRQGAMRTRIRELMNDADVATRVHERIGCRRGGRDEARKNQLVPCALRRLIDEPDANLLLRFLSESSGSLLPCNTLDCLCGRAPLTLSPEEVDDERSLASLAW